MIAHITAWVCFFALPYLVFFPRGLDFNSISNHQLASIISNDVFLVVFYYLNTLLLIPNFLAKEKWLWYVLSIVACLFFFLYIPKEIASWIAEPEVFNPNNREFIRNPAYTGKRHFSGMMRPGNRLRTDPYNTVLFLLVFTVGTCISVIQRWLQTEQNRKETENEKLNTELSFLKSQINPHFFFNTLNNIYSLAIVRS